MNLFQNIGRRRRDRALRESEKRLRAIWETAVEGIITIDERGSIESLNPAASRIFGYTPEKIIGRNVSVLMPSPDREKHDSYIANYLRTGKAKIIGIGREVVGQHKDGTVFPMDLSISEVRLDDRRIFTGLVRDITERKRAEEALRESEQRMRAILETAVEGIITIDERGIIESLNPAACRIFGYEQEELMGRNVNVLMPTPHREHHDGYLVNYLRTGQAKIIGIGREVVGLRRDGTTFPMELSVGEVKLGNRRMFTGLVRDISERRYLERAVAAAAEQERARISRELHDGLGQQLGGLLFMMNGLCRDLQSANPAQAETARQLSGELATAIEQARNLSHELYAVPPQPDGLMQALDNLAERVSSTHGTASEFASDTVLVHDPIVASHLYRVAQEAVHNALKHSRATRIWIELTQQPAGVELRVRDNGVGFSPQPGDVGQASSLAVQRASMPIESAGRIPPEPADRTSAARRGLGLRTMEQRARLIGGRLRVQTQPGAGVEVICSIPAAMLEKDDEAKGNL